MRQINEIRTAINTEDGDGVQLKRVFSSHAYSSTNPFVMLDQFGSNSADDYIGGFPAHPHKGFDTITFMLDGKMTHEDSRGNRGVISDFGVQWMRTGRGIIHSEMPAQREGKMRGMQFWLNIPSDQKSDEPSYLDYESIPTTTDKGNTLRIIAGDYNGENTPFKPEPTNVQILYLALTENNRDEIQIPSSHNALIYLLAGSLEIGGKSLTQSQLAILSREGDSVLIDGEIGSEMMIMSGNPIEEPMVQHGPFVMNSREEIQQAFVDFRAGKFES